MSSGAGYGRLSDFILILAFVILPSSHASNRTRALLQNEAGGTYAGYRVRQTCVAAGSTDQDGARVQASINFYLCCHDIKFGPGKLCCENCLDQWSEYFDWIYPCFKNQGGEKLQRRTEDAMDINNYKWDSTRYVWICAGPHNRPTVVLAVVIGLLSAYFIPEYFD